MQGFSAEFHLDANRQRNTPRRVLTLRKVAPSSKTLNPATLAISMREMGRWSRSKTRRMHDRDTMSFCLWKGYETITLIFHLGHRRKNAHDNPSTYLPNFRFVSSAKTVRNMSSAFLL